MKTMNIHEMKNNSHSKNDARVAREWLCYAAVFLLIFTLGVGNAWGETATSDCSSNITTSYADIESGKAIEWKAKTATSYTSPLRVNASNEVTFHCKAGALSITKIEITANSNSYANIARTAANWAADDDDATISTSGSNKAVTITITDGTVTTLVFTASAQTRWEEVVVTYTAGDAPSYTDIMFAKGFHGNTTSGYTTKGTDYTDVANATNATGVTYAMQVFNGNNGQLKGNGSGAENFSCRNTSTKDGYYISSISLTVKTGTIDGSTSGRSVVYFGTSAYSNPNTSAPTGTATTASPASSGQTTLTWTNSNQNVSHFILYNLKTANSAYSDNATNSLKVVWTKKSDCTAPTAPTNSSISSTGWTAGWTAPASAPGSGYVIVYKNANSAPGDAITESSHTGYQAETAGSAATSKAITLSGVSAGQTCYWWIRSKCGTGNYSSWLAGTSFVVPKITAGTASGTSTYVYGSGSGSVQTFTVSGVGLTGNLTVTAPSNFQVSTDNGSTWSTSGGSKTITASGTLSSTTVKFRLASGLSQGSYGPSNVVVSGGGAASVNVSVSGSVTAPASTWKFKYSGDSWTEHTMTESAGVASYSITLAADSRFEFGIDDNGTFYKNQGTIITTTSGWVFNTSDNNCKIHTGPAGTYTFAINTTSKAVTVTYPTNVTHPNEHYVYFKNTNVWPNVKGYLGNTGNDNKAAAWPGSDMQATTTICGELYHYAALNAMSGTYNVIIFNNGSGAQTSDLSTTGSLGKYNANTDANWHDFKYSITFVENGNTGGSMSNVTEICSGSDVTLVTNGYTKSDHNFTGWKTNAALTYVANGDADDGTHEVNVAVNGIVPNQAKIKRISSNITLTAQWEHVPVITVSQTSRAFGDRKVNGGPYEMTFNVEGSYLKGNISLAVSGTNAAMFSVSPTSLSPTTGTVSSTEITVSYSPTGAGSHTAQVDITSSGATSKTVTLTGTGKWEVTWNASGSSPQTTLVGDNEKPTFPSNPSSCDTGEGASTTFIGWTQTTWTGKQNQAYIDALTTDATKVHTSNSTMPNVTNNTTAYHAVFAQGTGSASDEWQLVTNANQLNEGDKIVFANGSSSTVSLMGYQVDTYEDDGVTPKSRNRKNATSTEAVSSSKITLTSSEIASSTGDAAKPYVLTLGKNGDYWTLYDDVYGGYLYAASPAATAGTSEKNWIYYRASDSDAASRWSISVSGTATILSQRTTSNRVYLKFNSGISSCYQSTTDGTAYGYIFRNLSDISYSDYMTTCCDKKVAITDGSLSHCTLAYSSTNQQTCSSTAADRQVTVTVTPSTGYGMSSSDRLTFTKISGTATATYISGPTGSGPYTFVYQFAQNDNGAGTFGATCTAKTYTITLNNQSATTAGTPNISVTFDANTNLTGTPAITVPTKTGYNFGGYYTGTSGSGTQIIAANGTVNASAGGGSTYTDASKNWKYANNIELYAKWTEKDLTNYRTECGLDITVEGSVWLTSYAGVEVFTTEASDNLITIDCDDFGSGTRLGVAYLLNGSPVTYTSSPFRLCWYNFAGKTNYNKVDADGSAGSASPYRYYPLTSSEKTALGSSQTFAISYNPGAGVYNQEHTYTLRIAVLDGSGNDLGHKDLELHGRALPQKFVIAANIGGQWRALPADLVTTTGTAVPDAYPIQVDNESTPTTAIAPKTAVYSGYTRNNGAQHRGGIRLQTQVGDGKDGYLEAPRSNSETYLRRTTSTNSNGMQEWYLKAKTTNFGLYNISLDPACTLADGTTPITRYLCVYSNQIYWGAQSAKDFRILPVTEYVPVEIQVVEWNTDKIRFMYLGDPANEAEVKINNVTKAATAELSTLKIDEGVYEIAVSDLTTNAYKQMHIIIKSSGTEVGRQAVNVPLLVNTTTTVYDAATGFTKGTQCPQMDLIVLSGGKLTADDATAYQFKTITVYGGGKLIVSASKGLTAKEAMTLRAGGVNVATKGATPSTSYIYTYPEVYIGSGATLTVPSNTIYFDYLTTKSQYYALAMPYGTTINNTNIFYPEDIYGSHKAGSYLMDAFNSATRASQGAVDAVWEDKEDVTPTRGLGYYFLGMPRKVSINEASAVRQKYGIQRIKMNITNASTLATNENSNASISLTYHSSAQLYNAGWNLLGNPFLADLTSGESDGVTSGASLMMGKLVYEDGAWKTTDAAVRYITVPNDEAMETYDQRKVKEYNFPAFKTFYVQIGADGNVTFSKDRRASSAPARLLMASSKPQEIEFAVALNPSAGAGDTTHLLIGEAFSDEYVIGDDMVKMAHSGVNVFSIMAGNDLFANAITSTSAQNGVTLGYIAPESGNFTFGLSDKDDHTWLKHVWLTDNDLHTQTDLLVEEYPFTSEAGTNRTRFTLNTELNTEEAVNTTTDAEMTEVNEIDYGPQKFIYQDKMYILYNGVIYDAVGKKVREINK